MTEDNFVIKFDKVECDDNLDYDEVKISSKYFDKLDIEEDTVNSIIVKYPLFEYGSILRATVMPDDTIGEDVFVSNSSLVESLKTAIEYVDYFKLILMDRKKSFSELAPIVQKNREFD